MKKMAILLSCIALVFLSACGSEVIGKEDYSAVNTPSIEVKKDTFGLNETAVFSNLKITATELKESKGDGFFTPESGNVFVGVNFVLENTSTEEQSISSLMMFEGYVDDIKSDYSFNAACAFDEGTLDGSIAPGKKMVGWYALEVPENWSSIELLFKENWLSQNNAEFVFKK